MSLALNPTSGRYFVKPCCSTSLCLTVLRKYQFKPASTKRMSTFEILSHTSLIFTNVSETGGTVCEGIHITQTAILIVVMRATVPHFSFATVLRCSTIKAIRFIIICIRSWISKTQKNSMQKRTGTLRYCQHILDSNRTWSRTHLGPTLSLRNSQPMIAMTMFAATSPQIM